MAESDRKGPAPADLDDDALLAEVLARRDQGRDGRAHVGALIERWRKPALYVIRRVQQSYRMGSADDAAELFQEAAAKLVERGLAQFRGSSAAASDAPPEGPPSGAAGRVFFLRIVKHTAIDHYRRHHEELAQKPDGAEDAPEVSAPEVAVAEGRARASAAREDAADLYWRAFARLRADHPGEADAWEAYHHLDLDDHEACAKRLGITVASSYKRISRAQARLRLILLELSDDERRRAD
jgi:RNA polymerase sigma-70 factor (ECF subfamily)